jgi:hypothetical protein
MISDNPSHLYTLAEAAKYCHKSYAHLRKLYSLGLLPDPAHTIKHETKTTRLFSLQEVKSLRDRFRGITRGDFTRTALKRGTPHGKDLHGKIVPCRSR